jgi:hypothetical protein
MEIDCKQLKTPYQKPMLSIYGSVNALTQGMMNPTTSDASPNGGDYS